MDYFRLQDNFKKISDVKSVLKKGETASGRTPVISVAIPTYKRPKLLKETLDSVMAQENFDAFEVIIVDNDVCPDNDTEKLLEQYTDERIIYYKNEKNLGMEGNWNRAIELCRCGWITILHDDDALHPLYLSTVFDVICKHELELLSCYCVCGEQIKFPEIHRKRSFGIHDIKQSKCLLTNISPFPGILFKKKIAMEIGGFDSEYFPIADYVFWTNYCLRYRCCMLEGPLAFYRTGTTTTSSRVYIDLINKTYSFKCSLLKRIRLPGFAKKILVHVGMRILIGGYIAYDSIKLIARESNYSVPGINNFLIRKAYGAAFRVLHRLTRVI